MHSNQPAESGHPAPGSVGVATPSAGVLDALVYAELRALAGSYFSTQPPSHTLQPTALVSEVFLKLSRAEASTGNSAWRDREHFLAVAATAMRQILVDHARAKACAKRGDGRGCVTLDSSVVADSRSGFDVIELDDAINVLANADARAANVVVLRFFGGLTVTEVARVLGVSESTVEGDWRTAQAWLALRLTPGAAGEGGR